MAKTIAINNGYYRVKMQGIDPFLSRVSKNIFGAAHGPGIDTLELNGESWLIGTGKVNLAADKTSSELTKLLILNALAKVTGKSESFNLGITTPPQYYKGQKDTLPEALKGVYHIIHNTDSKTIEIVDVTVFPETVTGFLANNPTKWDGRNCIVGDIGGCTTNLVLFRNKSFVSDDVITLKHGMYHIDSSIAQYLKGEHLELDTSDDDIQYYRDTNDIILKQEAPNIQNIYDEYMQEIITAMDKKGWNYSKYDSLWLGGGSITLIDTIQAFVPQAELSQDPVWDNWKGLDALTRRKYGKA